MVIDYSGDHRRGGERGEITSGGVMIYEVDLPALQVVVGSEEEVGRRGDRD